jgi:hypothetical protein
MPRWKWCMFCWKQFNGRTDKRFCSAKCRQAHWRKMHIYERWYGQKDYQYMMDPN